MSKFGVAFAQRKRSNKLTVEFESILGIAAGTCTTAAAVPQLIKSLKTKQVTGVSPGMFIVLIVGLSLWAIYGILRNDFPIIVTNIVSVLLNSTVLFLFFRYKNKGRGSKPTLSRNDR